MKKRILIVEDDAALSQVVCDILVFEGFEVELVTDGRSRRDSRSPVSCRTWCCWT